MGYCSRSQAAALIRDGRVALNGRTARDPENPVYVGRDRMEVDGTAITELPKVYFAMNKPRGTVTTASDEKGRKTVYDLLEPWLLPWVGPVGRLDKASEGLLLLTNDSEWAARITDPTSHLDKTYHVQVDQVADGLVVRITRGATVGGERMRVKAARVLRRGEKNSWLEITLDEGKNRHIRRLLEALDVRVLRLVRVAVGPLELGDLKKGGVRELVAAEKKAIDRALNG